LRQRSLGSAVLVRLCLLTSFNRCTHSTTISADRWPDNLGLSDIEPDFVSARGESNPDGMRHFQHDGKISKRPATLSSIAKFL